MMRNATENKIVLLNILLLTSAFSYAQPFPQAHAHNDYAHKHPLFDALRYGFISLEADVFLIHNHLFVAHTRPIFNFRTLEELYLKPLDSILRVNGGRIYKGYEGTFFLMIDIKSEATSTYLELKKILLRFPRFTRNSGSFLPVTIFLSGNRPIDLVINDSTTKVALDGRPNDLGKNYSPKEMPVISDNFNKWSDWNGTTPPLQKDMERISQLASKVHAEGKKLRLWAIPDNPECWKVLLQAGVDMINSDRLADLSKFLKSVTNQSNK